MTGTPKDAVAWHELECGAYREDLALWLALAERFGAPVLEVGAGTGRVALTLACAGHATTALDHDERLLAELERRADELACRSLLARELVEVVVADARAFRLRRLFTLIIVPMQTLQLLGGIDGRSAFLRCAAAHLAPGGSLAAAVATELEPFDVRDGAAAPEADVASYPDALYRSQPTAVRVDGDGFVLERRRELVRAGGRRRRSLEMIRIDRVDLAALRGEALGAGLRMGAAHRISATAEHVPTEVVLFNCS